MSVAHTIAVIADAHADLVALESVFAEVDGLGIRRVWNLGDFCVGGPQPVESFDLCLERCEINLLGNHELFVLQRVWEQLRGGWARAAHQAAAELGRERILRLHDLRPWHRSDVPPVELVHGSPQDPPGGFISGAADAVEAAARAAGRVVVCGHSHEPAHWNVEKDARRPTRADSLPVVPLHEQQLGGGVRLLNPGAVCDSRGARWLELRWNGGNEFTAIWHQTGTPGHGGVSPGPR